MIGSGADLASSLGEPGGPLEQRSNRQATLLIRSMNSENKGKTIINIYLKNHSQYLTTSIGRPLTKLRVKIVRSSTTLRQAKFG